MCKLYKLAQGGRKTFMARKILLTHWVTSFMLECQLMRFSSFSCFRGHASPDRGPYLQKYECTLVVSIVAILTFFMPFWYRQVYLRQTFVPALSLPPSIFCNSEAFLCDWECERIDSKCICPKNVILGIVCAKREESE